MRDIRGKEIRTYKLSILVNTVYVVVVYLSHSLVSLRRKQVFDTNFSFSQEKDVLKRVDRYLKSTKLCQPCSNVVSVGTSLKLQSYELHVMLYYMFNTRFRASIFQHNN